MTITIPDVRLAKYWTRRTAFGFGLLAGYWLHALTPHCTRIRVVVDDPAATPGIYIPSTDAPPAYEKVSGIEDDDAAVIERDERLAALNVVETAPPAPARSNKPRRSSKPVATTPKPALAPVIQMTAAEQALDGYRKAYIARHSSDARAAATTKVPVSVLLALALTEGGSEYAIKANNHFDERCMSKTCPRGHCLRSDQSDQHKWFFTRYKSHADSYRAKAAAIASSGYVPGGPAIERVIQLYDLRRFDQ